MNILTDVPVAISPAGEMKVSVVGTSFVLVKVEVK